LLEQLRQEQKEQLVQLQQQQQQEQQAKQASSSVPGRDAQTGGSDRGVGGGGGAKAVVVECRYLVPDTNVLMHRWGTSREHVRLKRDI
jgi:hypothetical protein